MKRQLLKTLKYLLITIYLCLNSACEKQDDWLNAKDDKSLVVPETMVDFQAILDNTGVLNNSFVTSGLVGTDNYKLQDLNFNASSENNRQLHIWNTAGLAQFGNGWNVFYRTISLANITLDGLKKHQATESGYNNIAGQALFFRAWAYYQLAQLFCQPYDGNRTDLPGLPLRLETDVNQVLQRSTLQKTYQQIETDLTRATTLLNTTQTYAQRPNEAACFALLSKLYLSMSNYPKALTHAEKALALKSDLLGYNSSIVNTSSTYRFPNLGKTNPEIVFYAQGSFVVAGPTSSSQGTIAAELYALYESNDLRKSLFFSLSGTNVKLRGTYSGNTNVFCGIATNEVYLIRAECRARLDQSELAIDDLNTLLEKRFKTGTFKKLVATDPQNVLKAVLLERRKELPFTGNLRWEDLRRLNKDSRFEKTITRTLNSITYSLPPGDAAYTLPIPTNETQYSGIVQN